MTLRPQKLPFRGDTISQLIETVDRVAPVGFVHEYCQMEYVYAILEGYPCGRKAVKTCTVCEVTQCDKCDCGCER